MDAKLFTQLQDKNLADLNIRAARGFNSLAARLLYHLGCLISMP